MRGNKEVVSKGRAIYRWPVREIREEIVCFVRCLGAALTVSVRSLWWKDADDTVDEELYKKALREKLVGRGGQRV